jgi:AcrR family transcriptional regulator
MPTKTFLNLSKKKQDIIIEASIKEFKRVLLKDASINKIIKDANISRGSFYNYFKDINDLYIYSLNNYKEKIYNLIKITLKNTNGDLLETTKNIYDKIIEYCEKEREIFEKIFLNINYNISVRNRIECEAINDKYKLIELLSKIDKSKLNIKKEEDLFLIIDMIIGFIIHGLIEIFLDNKEPIIIKQKIEKQLEILEKGISRR